MTEKVPVITYLWFMIPIFLEYYQAVVYLGYMVDVSLVFWEFVTLITRMNAPVCSPAESELLNQGSLLPTFSPAFFIIFLILAILG